MANNGFFSKWFNNWKESINKIKTGNGTYAGGITQWINSILSKNNGNSTENNGGTTTQNVTQLNAPANVTPTAATYSANVSPETVSTEGVTGNPTTTPTNTEGNSTETPTTPPATTPTTTEPTAETPMTYEEYIASEKERAEQERQQAHKEAEIAKERATVDAQSSYAQNKATYGANAETMAQMGLTGGGYSDYLDSQAYAQKRDDIQHANVVEAATKQGADTAYSDKISELNEKQITHNAEQQAYKDKIYSDLLAEAQNPNTTYTAESIREIAEKAGLSEEEIQGLVNTLTSTKDTATTEANNAKNTELYNSLWIEVQKPDTAYTVDSLTEFMRRNGMSEEDITALTGILQSTLSTTEANNAKNTSKSLRLGAIDQINKEGGLSTQYINELKAAGISDEDLQAVIEYNQNYHFTAVKSALNAGDSTTKADLDLLLRENRISQPQYDELLEQNQGIYNDYYTEVLDASIGDFDFSAADKAYKDGNLSQPQYDALKNKFNTDIANMCSAATLFYDYSKEDLMSENEAKDLVNFFKKSGWLSSDNTTKLDNLLTSAYKKEEDGGGSCVAKGTRILLPNGEYEFIENLAVGDRILSFDHTNGTCIETKVAYSYFAKSSVKIIKLNFTNGVSIELLNTGHGLYDLTLDKYVLITHDNVSEFVGHSFAYLDFVEGKLAPSKVELLTFEITESLVERYDIVAENKLNHIANGLLACSDVLVGISNMFDYKNLLCSAEKVASDIEKFGLYSYDEWAEYVSREDFDTFNGAYFKIAVEKGLLTMEELFTLIGFIKTQWENGNTSK